MRIALVATLAVLAREAHADDPRDLFGLGSAKKHAPQASCSDGKTLGCAAATDDFDPVSPYAVRTWLPGSYLLRLPVADARADEVVHFATGASRDEAGPVLGGASGLENRWTIEGAPVDSLRTGGVETRVPLTFIEGMLVQVGGFAARDRTSTGGAIDIQLRRGTPTHEVAAHVWASATADATRRPIPRSSYQLRRLTIDAGPDASASVVATGPLPAVGGGSTWYAAGIAPALAYSDFAWRAAALVDADGDSVPDGYPGDIALETIERTSERTLDYLVPVMARTGWQRGAHGVELTLVGQAQRDTSMLANATLAAAGIDRETLVGDVIATWRGRWRQTRARVQVAWHRSVRTEAAHDPAAQQRSQLLSAYVPLSLPEDVVLAERCDDPTAIVGGLCPIPFGFFASGGVGLLTDATADRPTTTIDIAHRHGRHVARVGGTFEDSRLVLDSVFSGGELIRSLFDSHVDRQRFYTGDCASFTIEEPPAPCNYAASQTLRYRTRYTAAYVEDTFEPAPGLRVNAGVRWELMWVGTRLHLSRQWAPRLGIAWEPVPGTRAWASMGRSFVMLPAGLGSTVIGRNRTVRDVEFGLGPSRTINPGNTFTVASGIQPAAQDEATVGVELGVPKILRFTGWVQGRTLRRGYETVLDGDGRATFDNPGRHGEVPATRDSMIVAAEVMIAPAPKLTFRATYLYGSTVGSWAGPFDPRQGTNLYNGDDWDADNGNLVGRLPTDAGHRVAFELERRGRVGSVELAAAGRLTTASGRPRNVLADGDGGVIYLLQRGADGRGELVSQANVRLAARWRRTDITLDVFNLFDQRTPTSLDELYTGGDIQPINGGSDEDLVWAKAAGDPAKRRTGYQLPLADQSPISATLGIRHAF